MVEPECVPSRIKQLELCIAYLGQPPTDSWSHPAGPGTTPIRSLIWKQSILAASPSWKEAAVSINCPLQDQHFCFLLKKKVFLMNSFQWVNPPFGSIWGIYWECSLPFMGPWITKPKYFQNSPGMHSCWPRFVPLALGAGWTSFGFPWVIFTRVDGFYEKNLEKT